MDESVNIESGALSKSDDNKKCISQKSAKFSIDSLLANTENIKNCSDINVVDDIECSDYNSCSHIDISSSECGKDPSQRKCSETASTEECGRKESEVVSTTEGFYEKNFGEGKYLCKSLFG